jgi:hypothetical protein
MPHPFMMLLVCRKLKRKEEGRDTTQTERDNGEVHGIVGLFCFSEW